MLDGHILAMSSNIQKSSRDLRIVVAATGLGFALVQLDVSIVNVALARIGADLGTGVGGLQWVVDAYALAFASLLLSAGAFGDRNGARRAFVLGFALFVAASLGCGLAPTTAALIAARAIQGVGAALLVPCSLTLLNHACHGDGAKRASAISLWTAAGSIGLSAGPVVGGFLVEAFGWRSVFLVNLPIGAFGIWLTLRFVDESPSSGGALDPAGQALGIVALVALTGAVIEAGSRGWSDPLVLSGVALAALSGAAFLGVEARVSDPMLPLGLFRHPAFSTATLVGLSINLTLYGVIFVLGLYLQQVRLLTAAASGLAFLPFPLALMLSNIAARWVMKWVGTRWTMVAGLLVGAVGYALLRGIDATTPYAVLLAGLLVIPLGIGLAVPAMTTALLATVPASRSGVASGVLNTVRQAAGAIGVALFGAFMASDAVPGIQRAFEVSVVLLALAAIAAAIGLRKQ